MSAEAAPAAEDRVDLEAAFNAVMESSKVAYDLFKLNERDARDIKKHFNETPKVSSIVGNTGTCYRRLDKVSFMCRNCKSMNEQSWPVILDVSTGHYSGGSINTSRLIKHIFICTGTSDSDKLEVAGGRSSWDAKTCVNLIRGKREAASAAVAASRSTEEEEKQLGAAAKKARMGSRAQDKRDEHQRAITEYATVDKCTDKQWTAIWYSICAFFFMCRIPFAAIDTTWFNRMLLALRPSAAKRLGTQARKRLAGEGLNELYADAVDETARALSEKLGKITMCIDWHKDGRGRSVYTLSSLKVGLAAFCKTVYALTNASTGENVAKHVADEIRGREIDVIAVVSDNTSNMLAMQEALNEEFNWLFYVGCAVHVLDLLIEDICKLAKIQEVIKDAHFVITFVKSHSCLHEEFLALKEQFKTKLSLKIFPLTRFAYAYLMLNIVHVSLYVFQTLLECSIVAYMSSAAQRRGGEEGAKAVAQIAKFKGTIKRGDFRKMLKGVHALLEPFSIILHFLEGDSVPPSWVYPCYQCLLDMLAKLPNDVKEAVGAATLEQVVDLVRERWLPSYHSRKVGLRDDLHLAAFALDPAVRAACSDSQGREPLMTQDVRDAVRNVLRRLSKSASSEVLEPSSAAFRLRASTEQHRLLMMSTAFDTYSSETSVFQSELKVAREDLYQPKIEKAVLAMLEQDPNAKNNPVKMLICKLTAVGPAAGAAFWRRAAKITDSNLDEEGQKSHSLLCSRVIDLLGVVISSCGTERHGKAYKLIHPAIRASIGEEKLNRAIFIFLNLDLLDKERDRFCVDSGDFADPQSFILSVVEEHEKEQLKEMLRMEEEHDEKARVMLPVNDTEVRLEALAPAMLEEAEFVLPVGFKQIALPEKLDAALCKMKPQAHIFMRWEGSGWELGVLKSFYPNGVALKDDHGRKKKERGNFNVDWIKDKRGHTRDMYLNKERFLGGSDAPVGSWVLLVKE